MAEIELIGEAARRKRQSDNEQRMLALWETIKLQQKAIEGLESDLQELRREFEDERDR